MVELPYNYRPPIAEFNPDKPIHGRYLHWKRNGHYLQIRKTRGKILFQTYSKKPTELTKSLEWAAFETGWGKSVSELDTDCILLGELFAPEEPASQVKSYIANQDARLQWECYAIAAEGVNGPTPLARAGLDTLDLWCESFNIPFVRYREVPFSLLPDDPAKLLAQERQMCPDLEGFMIKESNLVGWTRYKPMRTIDLIVVSCVYARSGKFGGLIGSLVCTTTEGHVVAAVSGMTDEERRWWTANINQMKGSVIEVQYQEVEARGRLRHANYVRLRDDKNPSECGLAQDQELLRRHTK